ncbi:hypothetical protein HanIR_Chr07g0319521 [Helianthus annuus]|nr:hypothetical protein HanIR_Chr07g0319521 [Helianthus annuus]
MSLLISSAPYVLTCFNVLVKRLFDMFINAFHTCFQRSLSKVYKFASTHTKRMNSLNFC